MNKKSLLLASLLAACAPLRSHALITLSHISAIANPGGGSDWEYQFKFINSTLNNGAFFTINDFGPGSVISIAPGWLFSQSLSGPNSLAATDDASILNATFTWNGGDGVVLSPGFGTVVPKFLAIHSPAATESVTREYTTIDQVSDGPGVGKVSGSVRAPSGLVTPGTTVPEGGATLLMLGFVFAGLGAQRMRARQRG